MSEPKGSLQSSHLQLAPASLDCGQDLDHSLASMLGQLAQLLLHTHGFLLSSSFLPYAPCPGAISACVVQVTPLQQGWDSQEPHQEHQHGSTLETGKASFPVPSLGEVGRCEPVPKQAAHPSLHRAVGRLGWTFWLRILSHRISMFRLAVGCVRALHG